jgi:predicted acetyltransferase
MASARPTSLPRSFSDPLFPPEMLRIGAALPPDVEQARALQHSAFGLAEAELLPPQGRQQELRVVARRNGRGDRVLSCLSLLHSRLMLRGAALRMGGIRHVATLPDEQNRGYAGSLLRDALRQMRRDRIPVSVLFPFSFRYYRKFGYELAGNHCHFWCRPNSLPAFAERARSRKAEPQDLPALVALNSRRSAGRVCTLHRTAEAWTGLLGDAGPGLWVCAGPGGLEGFAVTSDSQDRQGGRVTQVLDLWAQTPGGWRALIGLLSQQAGDSLEWAASMTDLQQSGLLKSTAPLREGFKPRAITTVRPGFQIRVVDVPEALACVVAAAPRGAYRLSLRIRDEVLPENEQGLAIQGSRERVLLRSPRIGDPVLELDIRIFSQILCGYLSPAEAVSQDLARASSSAALETAELLFPAGDPFIAELDRF